MPTLYEALAEGHVSHAVRVSDVEPPSQNSSQSVTKSVNASEHDLDQIWSQNASVPVPIQGCVHDLITEIASRQPDAQAVCAWDGGFSYHQLEVLTDALAHRLIELVTQPKSRIPIFFSKSRWTPVAMLGVMKGGFSCIALDPTQPDMRLRSIVQQAEPRIIVTSAGNRERALRLADVALLQIDEALLDWLEFPPKYSLQLPAVSPLDTVYISFTSGTTGQPKGACISHTNVRSAVHYQGSELGFHQGARVFDFAPYSFDVAWSNFLHTLCAGGTMCIASESDMLNDLSSAISSFNATLVNVTPTVLRTINPVPPTLETVLLSGEMPYRENLTKWAGKVRLLNTYGPTECTFKCAFSILRPSQDGRPDIGTGVGFCTWIIDPNDDNKLAKTGAVGELHLEGPLVGQGYQADPEKTASVFINDPSWLLAGSNNFSGRHGRVYRTGDLVKQNSDGRLIFVGRKDDSQLKIRGQRVEIGDVEHHVRACLPDSLPVIVDIILPRGSDTSSLTLFVLAKDHDRESVKTLLDGLTTQLLAVLPAFMIPSVYFPIDEIPIASTGKVDRRRLREMGSSLTWQEIVKVQSTILSSLEYSEPYNEIERDLRELWAKILSLDPNRISATDNFLRLGGDSIAAMHMVAAARDRNMSLTVADIFRTPILRDLARVTTRQTKSYDPEIVLPFSLLSGTRDTSSIANEAAKLCGVDPSEIEDVYPCTALQQGMLAMTAKHEKVLQGKEFLTMLTENYVQRTAFELPQDIDIERFQEACTATFKQVPITRTRIIHLSGEKGLVQVVVKSPMLMDSCPEIRYMLENPTPMGLGTPLCRSGIVGNESQLLFILEMHHAIFDGWSTMLVLDALEANYGGSPSESPFLASFKHFIKYVEGMDISKAANFWRNQLTRSEAITFPSPSYDPGMKLNLTFSISELQWPCMETIPSTLVRTALAILMASYTNSSDIIFGATVSGRQAPVAHIERIAGPTIATVPVRIKFDWDQTIEELLQQIQQQAVETTEYEQFGLQNIQHIDAETEEGSQFQLLLVIQPAAKGKTLNEGGLFSQAKSIVGAPEDGNGELSASSLVTKDGQADNLGIYNSYAMMIICQLHDCGLTFKINFDSGAVEQKEVERMAFQLENLLQQLCSEQFTNSSLRDLALLSETDADSVWTWNKDLPEAVEESLVIIIDRRATKHPEAPAISAWDKQLTYQLLKDLSTCIACRLQEKGVGPGSIVILSFEKSSWLTVSMIAVLRIGAIALPISAPTLTSRASEILETLQPKLVITSDPPEFSPFYDLIWTLHISKLVPPRNESYVHIIQPHEILPLDPALILFTSGSTGSPKSILWTHSTLSSNAHAACDTFGLTASSRVFQFAGYEFDVSTVEALSVLSAGGCLCIPSESDRANRLTGAINDAKANWMCLTPSVSETLSPGELPFLRTMVFAGEKLQEKVAERWRKSVSSLYNWYGPAEASVATSYKFQPQEAWKPGLIGRSRYALTWLVDPKNPSVLAPVGSIAELCLEGPILASYTGTSGPELNEQLFFSPSWLQRGHSRTPSQQRRLYRTGDLVKYDKDGRIIFIGRSHDSQRKLRGQRVDLSEIEMHAQTCLDGKFEAIIVAEIFSPDNSDNETLALFISPTKGKETAEETVSFIKEVLPVDELEAHLRSSLPTYMVPNLYIPIKHVPTSHSGKTDRRRLRQIGNSLTYEQLADMQPSRRQARTPSTDMEKRLQQLWADIIGIDAGAIYVNDNFLRLGGDSISAMRLVASARSLGLIMTVSDVFDAPQLEAMALRIKNDLEAFEQDVVPFSLLGPGISEVEIRPSAARLCSVFKSQVCDVFPCTPLQEGLLALGARRHGQYVSRSVLELQPGIDVDQLRRAWFAIVEKLPILRTRIIDLPGKGLVQVVLKDFIWRSGSDIDAYLRNDESEPMGLGTELCRAGIIDRSFIFTIHHCTYDGNSLKIILDELELQYLEKPGIKVTPFQNFIHHLSKIDLQEAADFWKRRLSNLELRQFPVLPSPAYEPQANDDLERSISLEWPGTGITPSTIIRSSWAILASQYMSSGDVVFGVTVSGRQANMRGVENCVAPTISTVPVAITINWDETIDEFLSRIQRQTVEMIPYEQYGLQNIQRTYGDLEYGLFQTLLVVQPIAEGKSLHDDSLLFKARTFASDLDTRGTDPFNTHALLLICELTKSGLSLHISFDNNVIDKRQVILISHQLETILRQLCTENTGTTKLDAVQTVSEIELDIFWNQNARLPQETNIMVHDAITLSAHKHPDQIAIDAWDGKFSYRQIDELSTILCENIISMGVTKGSIVALCFEKSKWAPIAQLGVFKAGAVTLLQSTVVPEQRVGTVFKNLGVQFALASEKRLEVISRYARCLTISQVMKDMAGNGPANLPVLQMSDPAAILVSSGSTGEPKQMLWSHRTIAANVKGHAECVSMDESKRVFQFASYDFDAATVEIMSTLINGGRLIVPSESDRVNGLAVAMNRFGANYINITPSTAKIIRPEEVPTLSTLVFSGENLVQADVNRWKGKCHLINWYGPAESSSATYCPADVDAWQSGVIGWTTSRHPSLSWLIDPRNHNKLVPFGAVGEIGLEGPTCADGYLGNPALTERLFRKDPTFLINGHGLDKPGRSGILYRSGDLGRFDMEGNLIYMGRKDKQLKIRGQLIAPEEVENHIRQFLASRNDIQVIVDAVTPENGGNITLVGFISPATQSEVEEITARLNEKLIAMLPRYAVPSYYIPISGIPTTPTGKRDRARLLEIGAQFNPPRQAFGSQRRQPTTTAERTLRELWSLTLGTDAENISANDSFLRVGDSIQAMRLVGIARQQNLLLTVANVFQHPILADMARLLKNQDDPVEDSIAPFALLHPNQDVEQASQHAATQCGVRKDEIEDLFPCTPLQEGLLALTMKRQGDYTGRNIMELAPSVDLSRFKDSWEKVAEILPILRTRIVDLPGQGLVQAVLLGRDCWTDAQDIEEYLRKECDLPMGLGSPLMRCGLFPASTQDSFGYYPSYFMLTMHHSIYDGLTIPLVLETLESIYNGMSPLHHCPFQAFVKYIGEQDKHAEARFWETQFTDLEAAQFPALHSSSYQPQTNSTLMHPIEDIAWRADDSTPSTVIRAAWALLCSQYSNSSDVVFGTVVAGRKAPLAGIERIAGPTIATVPIRVKIESDGNIPKLVATMQNQATEMTQYEQTGLSEIRKISDKARQACQFQTLVVVQPREQSLKDSILFVSGGHRDEPEGGAHSYHGFSSYALTAVCTLEASRLKAEICFDSIIIDAETIHRMALQFEQILRKICSKDFDQVLLSDLSMITDYDLNQIWKWNFEVPKSIERCMHDLITEVVQNQPESIAVSAWDGEMSYGLLDQLSSDIACRLIDLGVKRDMIIPLCFEKSMFSVLAILSVMKAGGAVLFLDPTLPISRLKSILKQVNPLLIISSAANENLASSLVTDTLVLSPDSDLMRAPRDESSGSGTNGRAYVAPSDLLYVIFTSGSTGTPKGCLITHRNFCSAVHHQRTILRLNKSSRMYDFSSYTFDATYWSAFHVLTAGGTLCIPSEEERKSDLTESIRKFHTTDIFLTPSIARLLDASRIPTLRNIHLGGEEVTKDDVAQWMPYAKAFNSYGPAECSAGSMYWNVPDTMPSTLSIGKGAGASTWILDPLSGDRLSPIGTVGELYLEGPLVGKGYVCDEEKTSTSFNEDPSWLLNGSPGGSIPGRRGRLYKTGDLVRYNPIDGTLIFVGRKDTQVKLRGQRIELSEVEYSVRYCLSGRFESYIIIAEVVTPNATGNPTLVVFMQLGEDMKMDELAVDLEVKLQERLPSYMVPSAYITIDSVPLTTGGKSDRKRLREMGARLTLEQLSRSGGRSKGKLPSTENELCLRKMWSNILGVPAEAIGADSSLFRLGGDSISAMRLAALARNQGISLTVQNILTAPRLSEMAKTMMKFDVDAGIHGVVVKPFSLLKKPEYTYATLSLVARQCGVEVSQIEDGFPCTGVQKSLLSMTAKSDNSYVAKYLLRLRDDVDVFRLKQAWQDVSRKAAPILRYRIVDAKHEGLLQVQLNVPLEFDTSDNVERYLEADRGRSMGLGTPLTRLALIRNPNNGEHYCLLTQHHAVYDGYSLDLLLREVSKAYVGVVDNNPVAPFQEFIKHVQSIDQKEALDFWRREFSNFEGTPFPSLPEHHYQPKANSTVRRNVDDLKWPDRDATASTIIRAAWTILTARYTDSEDVVFGVMVTGRQIPLAGIDRMVAPLIAALPVRVKFDPKQRLDDLLSDIQKQSIAMIPYEHTELLDIRRINSDTERGSRFSSLLVVQPAGQGNYMSHENGPFDYQSQIKSTNDQLDDFNPNAVMIMCQLTDNNGLNFEISFDSKIVDPPQMERIGSQFEHVMRQICFSGAETVEEIQTISVQDVKEIWEWNASVPAAIEECVHNLIGNTVQRQSQAPAVCSWDGNLSYGELDYLSHHLALHLAALGVGTESIIPLCFEKSMWYPIAALGAMKAGAACVSMDSTQPEARLRSIVEQIKPKFILSSASNEKLTSRIFDACVIIVDKLHMEDFPSNSGISSLPMVQATDVLYVVFTSGSTGVPKGVVTTHGNFASAAIHQIEALNIKPATRVFDFVSYNFDVSWSNTLQTLICGGTLCIPSEWERINDIPNSLNQMKCDYVYFTPSVARSLEPSSMPGIKTLAMGGEPIKNTEVLRWMQAETIIGIYGPAECAQALSFTCLNGTTQNSHVGYSFGANTWLVQPGYPDRLAPIGTIGELLIEGPTVSKGYFEDPERTAAAYIQDPAWLVRGVSGHPGRRGRLYKTGDLLQYNSDGSLVFMGRKDGLIKLRGQRIELGDVENHVRRSLHDPSLCDDIVAEIIVPQNSTSPILAIFVSLPKKGDGPEQDIMSRLSRVIEGLEETLSQSVPQYMIPGAYIPLGKIPMTTTNKTDRRALRELGNFQTLETLAQLQSHSKQQRQPTTPIEIRLQALWSSVLGIDPMSITADSNFLRIGGESIAAMRLVSAAREQQLSLTVADVFKSRSLAQLALLANEAVPDEYLQPQPQFSLLKSKEPRAFIEEFVEPSLEIGNGAVEDVIPATDFQERAIMDALQNPPSRLPHWILDLPVDVDFFRLETACQMLVQHFDILRTVFIQAKGRFWQVVLSDFKVAYDNFDSNGENLKVFTNTICAEDLERPRQLGRSFIRFMAVRHSPAGHKLIFRISHAQFDGYSWGMVLQTLSSIYSQEPLPTPFMFSQYISFNERQKTQSLKYWTYRLNQCPTPGGGSGDSTDHIYSTEDRLNIKETIKMPDTQLREGISPASLFHAACALVLSQQFEQVELVFGRLVTGRSMLPPTLQNVIGPCMTEIPIRITISPTATLVSIAQQLQAQFIEDSTREAAGMVEIIRHCTNWPEEMRDFGWRTAFQQEEDAEFRFLGEKSGFGLYEGQLMPRNRPEVYATPREGWLDLEFEGNKRLFGEDTAREFMRRLKVVLGGL